MESIPLSSPSSAVIPSPKRKPGRPPKPISEAQEDGSNQSARKRGRPVKHHQPPPPADATSEKRTRGRPPKQVPFASEPGSVEEKPKGRPRKSGIGSVSRSIGKRPRGRPPKVGGGVGMVTAAGKRRGRPPKGISAPRKPRRIPGKPLGRPKKVASAARVLRLEQEQTISNEELTSKLELIQLKVREAVGIIRPYVANEYAAIMALQQLEELMTAPATSMGPHNPPPAELNLTQPATMPEPGYGPATVPGSGPFFGVPGPFSVNLPALNVTGPLHVPFGMESQ